MSGGELGAYVRQRLRSKTPEEIRVAYETLLVALNLAPVHFDYLESAASLLGDSLAGLYDPETDTLMLSSELDPREASSTLRHELVHTLQDQHFHLDDRLTLVPDGSDRLSALHALAEGDATCFSLGVACEDEAALHQLAQGFTSATEAGSGDSSQEVPPVLIASALASYVDGLRLVRWLKARGGWSLVNDVWAAPPQTTEQVIHPEKLMAREPQERVSVPVPPSSEFGGPLHRDILGEQSLRIVFGEWLDELEAATAAADWAGDRLAVFAKGDRFAVAWHVRYDNETAAMRGESAFAVGAELHSGSPRNRLNPSYPPDVPSCHERPLRGPIVVVRQGRDIAVTAGPFRRMAGNAQSDGGCSAAVAWAQRVLVQP
jgi:hypothetical protein